MMETTKIKQSPKRHTRPNRHLSWHQANNINKLFIIWLYIAKDNMCSFRHAQGKH